jgi:hypothetical protein
VSVNHISIERRRGEEGRLGAGLYVGLVWHFAVKADGCRIYKNNKVLLALEYRGKVIL